MSGIETKKTRSTDVLLRGTNYSLYLNGSLIQPGTPVLRRLSGSESIWSTGHPWPPKGHSNGISNIGGSFTLIRREYDVQPGHVVFGSKFIKNDVSLYFDSDVWPDYNTAFLYVLPVPFLNSVMVGKGTVGWNRLKPTAKHGQLGQALGELKDFPKLPVIMSLKEGARKAHSESVSKGFFRLIRKGASPKHLGSEYLNWVFGWQPLLSDIRDLARNVLKAERNLKQLHRDNGNWIRRSGTISHDETSQSSSIPNQNWFMEPAFPSNLVKPGSTTVQDTTVYTERFWFSGAFRYWLGKAPDDMSYQKAITIPGREKYQLSRILFGLDPTDPSLAWELFPWSWLSDWVVPIGPIIDNFYNDSADNLVAAYAYSMAHAKTHSSRTVQCQLVDGQVVGSSCTVKLETMQRTPANPYGFGISYSGLSANRLAILAALGATRLHD
ncbi:TPA_asm: maturation protein [ssRNA phage Gephyllon.4_10]|uniref:Maturation protein n=2 Tax=Leviviricetes TaxID=2842243 RepID=A0A8S5L458_9VIRU|nr:maturation protein [ssRNA phage Gephyllon.4_10]QDH86580.1 MAG: hypothetical protein H4BulkLitter23271_000004 [Leviviridae sp.]DAD52159.1 TPA_asm: maturation protein [ssRNA phage Gephyllon.4_10]